MYFAGGCFPRCACASGSWTPTKSIRCSSTSFRWTTNGTGTRTISLRGLSRARRTRRRHTVCTRTPTRRSPAISCTRHSCRSRKSNWPTTRWTLADKWALFDFYYIICICLRHKLDHHLIVCPHKSAVRYR